MINLKNESCVLLFIQNELSLVSFFELGLIIDSAHQANLITIAILLR